MPKFKLILDPPEKIVFGGKKLGEKPATVVLKITNPLKKRVALKVKCTSNDMFRIRPSVSVLKARETATVNLVFNAGKTVPTWQESDYHYFSLYYIIAKDDKPPRTLWSEHKGDVEGTKRMYVDFSKEEEAKKDEEKKKETEEDLLLYAGGPGPANKPQWLQFHEAPVGTIQMEKKVKGKKVFLRESGGSLCLRTFSDKKNRKGMTTSFYKWHYEM